MPELSDVDVALLACESVDIRGVLRSVREADERGVDAGVDAGEGLADI